MPHCWIYNPVNVRDDQMKESLFVQFRPDLLSNGMMFFNETKTVAERIMAFKQGFRLKGECADNIRHILVEMKTADNEQRLLLLFQLLLCIGKSEELEVVSCECHKAFICKKQERLRKAFNYITNNYQHPITLNEISKAMAMSETSFSRFFRKETGEPFIAFLNKYRICNVCSLLSNCPQLDVNEAAWKCGFNDIPYFNRCFKKEKGMSPKAWRIQNTGR